MTPVFWDKHGQKVGNVGVPVSCGAVPLSRVGVVDMRLSRGPGFDVGEVGRARVRGDTIRKERNYWFGMKVGVVGAPTFGFDKGRNRRSIG